MSKIDEFKIIHFDSVISLSLVTENLEKKRALYVMRLESLDETIFLRKCNPISDFCMIKESLFIIRKISEQAINESSLPLNETELIEARRLNYNQNFILQHMVSKKFLSKDKMSGNNNYKLKLVENEILAAPFTFKKIVDTKSAITYITFNQIIYLSIYVKEKAQYYFINQLGNKKDNIEFSDLVVEKDFNNKFIIINQKCYGHDDGYLYSGDLVNITFQEKQQLNEKNYMIGVECQKEVKTGELISLKEEVKEDIDNFMKDNGQQGNDLAEFKMENKNESGIKFVKSYNLKKELFKHINHYSFWIIEEEFYGQNTQIKRKPLSAENFVRIKNPLLNLYLKITKKPQIEGAPIENNDYEFELVEENSLKNNSMFNSNFQIFHYSINVENKSLSNRGKYVIKSIFKEFKSNEVENKFDINSINSYFEPISLFPGPDDKIGVRKGEEFVFEIKKIDIYKGNEAIYLKRIIEHLDFLIKSYNKKFYNQSNVIDVISKHIIFFNNYLMNLDYSFKDINLETNYPIPERQNLLRKYKILDIITQIILYFLPTIKPIKGKFEGEKNESNSGLQSLMKQILNFLTNLSNNNEKIKQEIFCAMKNILELCECLFQKDRTTLLDFIFVILKGSTTLQECVLGSNIMLINSFKSRKKNLSMIERENLIQIDKIFSYIETSIYYLIFYKNIITFDKVSYKADSIKQKIKDHMNRIINEFDTNNSKLNYKRILDSIIRKIKILLYQRKKLEEKIQLNNPAYDGLVLKNIKSTLIFLNFFQKFDLNSSLFLKESFFKEFSKPISKGEKTNQNYLDKKLNFIFQGNIKPEKVIGDLDIDVKSQLAPIFPLHFYNTFFPKIEEKDEKAILEGKDNTLEIEFDNINLDDSLEISTRRNINKKFSTSRIVLPKIKKSQTHREKNNMIDFSDEESESENEENKKKILEGVQLNKYLCIIYSIYQFCINQYFEAVYKVLKNFKNILINYDSFGNFDTIKEYLAFIRVNLFEKVVFINNPIMTNIYKNVKDDPTIIEDKFNFNEKEEGFNTQGLVNEEIYLIRYLFYFCKTYDKINFLLGKLRVYNNIHKLSISEGQIDYLNSFQKITQELNNNRQNIIALYQNLNTEKNELISSGRFHSSGIKAYLIEKRIIFVTKLLGKYDISHYFDKIIYIKNEELLSHIKASSYEFYNIKEQIEKIHNEFDGNNPSDEKQGNTIYISNIINSLIEISTQFHTIFNNRRKEKIDSNRLLIKNNIESMLIVEDDTYFRKIQFPEVLHKLIDVINSFSHVEKASLLKLEYCKEILRIFISMTKNYFKFNKLLETEIDIYIDLVNKSLESVKIYTSEKFDDKQNERVILSIIYNSSIAFMYLIENSKMKFYELKNYITKIFELYFEIYQDLRPKIKIIYHIFYIYLVTRVLLFLNRDKAYDFYYYEVFFQKIYPLNEIRNRTLYCIKEINSHSRETPEEEESEVEESHNQTSENISSDNIHSEIDIEKDEEVYEQEEKYEFTIFLNFLNIYVIYLNELNSIRQNIITEQKGETKFKFKSINEKIKLVLDSSIKITDDQIKANRNESFDDKNSFIKGQTQLKVLNQLTVSGDTSNQASLNPNDINSTQANLNNDNIKTIYPNFINNYEFESVLLESIIYYKLEKRILEIGIIENKRYKFYYYDTDFIDLILIEKILRGIEIKNKLRDFCEDNPVDVDIDEVTDDNSSNEEKNYIPLMNILIQNLQSYELVVHYHRIENEYYEILHEEFIKNDMVKFIESLIKKFNKNDLENIYAMKFFNYIKMNEMYPQEKQFFIKGDDTLSLVETLLKVDNNSYSGLNNKYNLYLYNDYQYEKKNSVNINKLFDQIMYLYPQYSKQLTKLFYIISFKILHKSCLEMNKNNSQDEYLNFVEIINGLISLFKREINQTIILDKELFSIVLRTISIMLTKIIKDNSNFVVKNPELFKSLFSSFDFILERLARDLSSILNFMKKPESSKISEKSTKKEEKLEITLIFLTTVFMYNNIGDLSLLPESLRIYNSKIVEQIIKLLFVLLKFNYNNSFSSIVHLLDFLNNFIDGPDIENLHLLFSQGYLDLMKYVITNVDYYKLFIENINKESLYDCIDNMIEIEYKMMKIFFIYFNVAFHDKKELSDYIKIRKFYDENFENITNKLKRIYYISTKEMENKKFDIDKMLKYNNHNDFYSDEDIYIRAGVTEDDGLYDEKEDQIELKERLEDKSKDKNIKINNRFCLIKFEIILIYYTLYIFQREIMYENYFDIQSSKTTFFERLYKFFHSLVMFIVSFLITPYNIIKIIIRCFGSKKKTNVSLFEQLYDIDDKYLKVEEKEMMSYMKENISSVEVSLNDILYKVYFPILTKSKKIRKNTQTYLKVESDQLQNYIYHIMNNYDKINIEATQNSKIDSILELPFIKIIYQNMDLLQTLSLLVGIIINIFILISYSTFTNDAECDKKNPRLNCPYFLYKAGKGKLKSTRRLFRGLGFLHLILTICLFLNYYFRIFGIELIKSENSFKMSEVKNTKKKKIIYPFWRFISSILIPAMFNSLFNFESLFYMLALGFNLLGIFLHNFFYGFMLVEVIVRVEVMKNVLLAIYVPWRQIIITLLIFLVIIYYFSLFALTYFPSHFKIISDTKNFLNTFMRVFDQGFKQDGGVGTYLDKTLEPHYVPYTYKTYLGIRFWYDNIFYYIAITTIFQMFLSIINNYFSSQREDQEKFAEIVETQCIICGIEREALEKMYSNHKAAFEIHTNHDHNITDYICYLNYLQILTNRDIVEDNVWKLHLGNNYFFLPKNTCFKLKERRILENSGNPNEN